MLSLSQVCLSDLEYVCVHSLATLASLHTSPFFCLHVMRFYFSMWPVFAFHFFFPYQNVDGRADIFAEIIILILCFALSAHCLSVLYNQCGTTTSAFPLCLWSAWCGRAS